jgi:hypothetical protein
MNYIWYYGNMRNKDRNANRITFYIEFVMQNMHYTAALLACAFFFPHFSFSLRNVSTQFNDIPTRGSHHCRPLSAQKVRFSRIDSLFSRFQDTPRDGRFPLLLTSSLSLSSLSV